MLTSCKHNTRRRSAVPRNWEIYSAGSDTVPAAQQRRRSGPPRPRVLPGGGRRGGGGQRSAPRRQPGPGPPPAELHRDGSCGAACPRRSARSRPPRSPGEGCPRPGRQPRPRGTACRAGGPPGERRRERPAAQEEPEEMTYFPCEPSVRPRPCPAAAGPGHRGGGARSEGKMLRRRSRDAARARRGRGGPRGTAMPGHPGRAATPRSRFGAPRGVTPSTRQRHPARCPSRRARSQGRRAPPDPPEPGPYPRAGRRCLH